MATPAISSARRTITNGPLLIAIGPELDTCVVALVGELDYGGVPALKQELDRLSTSGCDLILDLESLEFIDSTGIKCLMRATRKSRANGDHLRILSDLHPHVERVLRISGAHDVLPFAT